MPIEPNVPLSRKVRRNVQNSTSDALFHIICLQRIPEMVPSNGFRSEGSDDVCVTAEELPSHGRVPRTGTIQAVRV